MTNLLIKNKKYSLNDSCKQFEDNIKYERYFIFF